MSFYVSIFNFFFIYTPVSQYLLGAQTPIYTCVSCRAYLGNSMQSATKYI